MKDFLNKGNFNASAKNIASRREGALEQVKEPGWGQWYEEQLNLSKF
jgi:hypothetical protein